MCGIISIKGKDVVRDVLYGLEKLEYRGYDSCGIGYKSKKINICKVEGYISKLKEKVCNINSDIVIGHTRWATHGEPSAINSHPHISEKGNFAVVHNGIIENYLELKNKYLKDVNFLSKTDTEVIPNLIEYFYNKCNDVKKAFLSAIEKLVGAYAFVMINNYDDCIYFVRVFSPLVLAETENSYILSSDVSGLKDKSKVFYIPDNAYGIIDNKCNVYNINCEDIDIKYENASDIVRSSNKNNYNHYMEKEIHEIPASIVDTYKYIKDLKITLPSKIDNVILVACGTSYHSSLIWKKFLARCNIRSECEIASEFIYNDYTVSPNTIAVFITQSGETADTIKALKKAKKLGLYTLAITNVASSSITKLADETVYMKCGEEICVASTKAYTTQIFVGIIMSTVFESINHNEFIPDDNKVIADMKEIIRYLPFTDYDIENLISMDIDKLNDSILPIARMLHKCKHLHIIGKDYDYITALESSLKIKEISYIFTDAYPSGELKHGTLSLIDDSSYVIAVLTDRKLLDKCQNSIQEINSRGGKVILFTSINDVEYKDVIDVIFIPNVAEIFRSIISIVPIQLLAYRITCLLGYNPDKPRNLAKSVTVE